VQLRRIREGTQIEEDHMRNRQMIVQWLLANSSAIEVRSATVRPTTSWWMPGLPGRGRPIAGRSPANQGGRGLCRRESTVRTYGVHFDRHLRDEVVARVEYLNMPSYTGFVQPRLEPVRARTERDRRDDLLSLDLTTQMLEYSGRRP
jgi:dipeptidyl-peptidase-3